MASKSAALEKIIVDNTVSNEQRRKALDALCGIKSPKSYEILGGIATNKRIPSEFNRKALDCLKRKHS